MWQKYSKWIMLFAIPVWVGVSFFAAQAIVLGLAWAINQFYPLEYFNSTLLNFTSIAITYVIAIILVLAVPWFVKKKRTTPEDVGLDRLPSWSEIFITPAGLVVYLILSSILIMLATGFIPGFDANQVQEVGFGHLGQQYEYILAFIMLVIAVPFAEELLFRGYLFGKLKKFVPVWVAILVTSVLFGVLHGTLNVAIDVFALSVVLCVMRQITGSIWPAILLHMAKNGIAFYFLFINTSILTTIGG